ncbi:MAG: MarR family transcriptional regulator [Chloroflexota bacterium]
MVAAKLDSELCFALYSASNHLTSIYRPLLQPLRLTYTQFVVMMALWDEDNVSISKLAQAVNLSKATMTPLLKRLEHKGFIQVERLANNERQKNVVLTESGHDISRKSAEITKQAFCATGLSKQQAKELIALCKLVVAEPESDS